jgi:hypothetical protein
LFFRLVAGGRTGLFAAEADEEVEFGLLSSLMLVFVFAAISGTCGQTATPISNATPPSTFPSQGATSVALAAQTNAANSCGYSVKVRAQYRRNILR